MEENGMSLKQLLKLLWLSLKKSIIFIVIGVFVISAVLFSIREIASVSTYRTEIVFRSPTEDALSVLTANKGYAVNEALSKTNKPITLSTDLLEGLSVTAVLPEKIDETESFIPTTFEITLRPEKDTGLMDAEYKEILDAVAVSYINLFALDDMANFEFNYDVQAKLANVEHVQVASELYENANAVLNSVKGSLGAKGINTSYATASGKTFASVISALESEVNGLSQIQYVIASNKVETANKGFKAYMEWNISNLDAKIAKYTALLSSAQKNLEDYNVIFDSKVTDKGETIYVLDSEVFLTLNDQILEYSNALADAQQERTEKADLLTVFNGATENANAKTYVEQELLSAKEKLAIAINDYKELAKNYNQNKYLTSDANIVKPTYERKVSPISLVVIILGALVVAIVIFTIGCVKVYPKFKEEELATATKETK